MSTVDPKDLQNRDRTFADRKAFVLSEQAIETAKALAEATAPKAPEAISTDSIIDPNWQRGRDRQAVREAATAARRASFFQVLGEMVFRALPFDDHEKAPHRESVITQTTELVESLKGWELSAAGQELLETAAGVADGIEGHDLTAVTAAIAESMVDGELAPIVEHLSSEIEDRVVAAVVATRERAAATESRLVEATAESSGDAELDALRARRAAKRTAPSLLEALFVANRRALTESEGAPEVSAGVLMMEAVSQYTLLETLSAIDIVSLETFDVATLARRLSGMRK